MWRKLKNPGIFGVKIKNEGENLAHPFSRPLPFRSLQELRRHLNCCFLII
jgi:hypothetical protein